jgi:hypothetical protein
MSPAAPRCTPTVGRATSTSGATASKHVVTNVSASGDPAHVVLPQVHRLASLVQRWILGTHQGAISHAQLDYYLDEFTFRFNRRHSRHRGLLFYRLLEGALAADPHPYKTLTSQSAG